MKKLVIVSLLSLAMLSGCSKDPLDKTFDLTSFNSLSESSGIVFKETSENDAAIIQWAMDSIGINDKYDTIEIFKDKWGADITYRKMIKMAIGKRKPEVNAQYDQLKAIEKEWTDLYNDLSKIKATNVRFGEHRDPFLEKGVWFDIHNGSQQNLSSIQWYLELYLDDEKEPYATYRGLDLYKFGENGLRAGQNDHRFIKIDDFMSDSGKKWYDLRVKNAKKKTIKATVIPNSAENFSDEKIITGNLVSELEKIESEKLMIANAEKLL